MVIGFVEQSVSVRRLKEDTGEKSLAVINLKDEKQRVVLKMISQFYSSMVHIKIHAQFLPAERFGCRDEGESSLQQVHLCGCGCEESG